MTTTIETNRICKKCSGTSFYRDQDDDPKCLTCGKVWGEGPLEVDTEVERKKRQANYSKMTAQQRADARYRDTELYKQTRRKHQKKYRESNKGKEAKKRHREKTQILERLVQRLTEMGWIE